MQNLYSPQYIGYPVGRLHTPGWMYKHEWCTYNGTYNVKKLWYSVNYWYIMVYYNTDDWGKYIMRYIINSGIYAVDLKGTNNAEFVGIHPSLIMRSIKNEDMYYVIPLTTYSKDKWQKLRKLLCCRIISINSIARIDKMQIIHKNKIPKRWFEDESLLVPTPNEILTVYNRVLEYTELSINKSVEEYKKFYENYEILYKKYTELFVNPTEEMLKQFIISSDIDNMYITTNLECVSNLSFEDVKRILWSILGKDNIAVTYDKVKNILLVKVNKNNKNVLTLKTWYDNINLTEEHK